MSSDKVKHIDRTKLEDVIRTFVQENIDDLYDFPMEEYTGEPTFHMELSDFMEDALMAWMSHYLDHLDGFWETSTGKKINSWCVEYV